MSISTILDYEYYQSLHDKLPSLDLGLFTLFMIIGF